MEITKDTLWENYMGLIRPLNELEDSHLANIILHVRTYHRFYNDGPEIVSVCEGILLSRGIDPKFNKLAQIPHKNLEGNWACWDYEKNKPIVLQK